MPTGNSSFTKVITLSLEDHGTEIFDAVVTNNALLYMLQQRGNVKVSSGGRAFTHPIYYKKNTSFGSYGKLDTIGTPLMDDITRATYDIKIIAGSLVVSTFDEAANAGDKQKLIDLIEETRMGAETSMGEELGDQVFKDGSGANDFDGLQAIISDNQDAALGGITPSSTNTYWRPYVDTTSVTGFNTSSAGLTEMNTTLNAATYGRQGPKAVITTKTIYGLYEVGLTSQQRYVQTELADAAFRHLAFATMPVLFDDNCPASRMYFVDTASLWLQVLAKGNMKLSEWQPAHDQLARTALMYLFGNLTCGSRRTQGVITSITG